jgi:hypothetical protein
MFRHVFSGLADGNCRESKVASPESGTTENRGESRVPKARHKEVLPESVVKGKLLT